MNTLRVYIDDIEIIVTGTYNKKEGDGIREEYIPAHFDIYNYIIDDKDREYLRAWHTEEELDALIEKEVLEQYKKY